MIPLPISTLIWQLLPSITPGVISSSPGHLAHIFFLKAFSKALFILARICPINPAIGHCLAPYKQHWCVAYIYVRFFLLLAICFCYPRCEIDLQHQSSSDGQLCLIFSHIESQAKLLASVNGSIPCISLLNHCRGINFSTSSTSSIRPSSLFLTPFCSFILLCSAEWQLPKRASRAARRIS